VRSFTPYSVFINPRCGAHSARWSACFIIEGVPEIVRPGDISRAYPGKRKWLAGHPLETYPAELRYPLHRRVTTGHNGDVGRRAFFRFLPATTTHWYALTTNPFPASAPAEENTMAEIQEHMKVLGKDGVPVGTVDRVEGDRVKLTKKDSPEGHKDHHHYIDKKLIGAVEGDTVKLSVNADAVPKKEGAAQ